MADTSLEHFDVLIVGAGLDAMRFQADGTAQRAAEALAA